jgi:hypothetical protein
MLCYQKQINSKLWQLLSGWSMGQGAESYRGRKCVTFITELDHSKVIDVVNLLRKQISNSIIVLRERTHSKIIVRL